MSASTDNTSNLYIIQYTERSIVVMGNTLNHSDALVKLGGKYTSLRIGQGWLFPKTREDTVRKYIETGEIVPYVYPKNTTWQKSTTNDNSNNEQQLRKLFREFRNAFDANEEYDGNSIIDIISKLETIYMSNKPSQQTNTELYDTDSPLKQPVKRLARKLDSDEDDSKEKPKRLARKLASDFDSKEKPKRLARKLDSDDESKEKPKRTATKPVPKRVTKPVKKIETSSEEEMESEDD